MPKIKPLDMKLLDLLFEMEQGYVLDFSNRTLALFFLGELEIDIDDPLFAADGTSKARRLRCFLTLADTPTCVRTLKALWQYRQAVLANQYKDEPVVNAEGRFLTLIWGGLVPTPHIIAQCTKLVRALLRRPWNRKRLP